MIVTKNEREEIEEFGYLAMYLVLSLEMAVKHRIGRCFSSILDHVDYLKLLEFSMKFTGLSTCPNRRSCLRT